MAWWRWGRSTRTGSCATAARGTAMRWCSPRGLGVGVFSAALKQGTLASADYATMIRSTTQLNAIGAELAGMDGVHAMTDVTGFGLLGHLREMAAASGMTMLVEMADVPLLPGAAALAETGIATGAGARNWDSYGEDVALPDDFAAWRRALLCDPQTSGGLLVSVSAEAAGALLDRVRQAGFGQAAVIGRVRTGNGSIRVA